MKKFILLCALCAVAIVNAQKNETYLKANALFLPVGMLNAGVEHSFSKHFTGQFDVFISPWKSFNDTPLQIYLGTIEGRYYFKEAFNHWFVGFSVGFGVFNLRKWNYWNSNDYYDKETGENLGIKHNQTYQKGFAYVLGITTGYQWKISEKWNMEIFAGFGNQQGFYKGYVVGRPENQDNRYDRVENWDKSGEMIPFKGGLMFSYKL